MTEYDTIIYKVKLFYSLSDTYPTEAKTAQYDSEGRGRNHSAVGKGLGRLSN